MEKLYHMLDLKNRLEIGIHYWLIATLLIYIKQSLPFIIKGLESDLNRFGILGNCYKLSSVICRSLESSVLVRRKPYVSFVDAAKLSSLRYSILL